MIESKIIFFYGDSLSSIYNILEIKLLGYGFRFLLG